MNKTIAKRKKDRDEMSDKNYSAQSCKTFRVEGRRIFVTLIHSLKSLFRSEKFVRPLKLLNWPSCKRQESCLSRGESSGLVVMGRYSHLRGREFVQL